MENNKRIENAKNQLNDLKQMVFLIYRNYRDRDTQMLSIALTYYSLLAIFPIVALILGITRGFGLEKMFISYGLQRQAKMLWIFILPII